MLSVPSVLLPPPRPARWPLTPKKHSPSLSLRPDPSAPVPFCWFSYVMSSQGGERLCVECSCCQSSTLADREVRCARDNRVKKRRESSCVAAKCGRWDGSRRWWPQEGRRTGNTPAWWMTPLPALLLARGRVTGWLAGSLPGALPVRPAFLPGLPASLHRRPSHAH